MKERTKVLVVEDEMPLAMFMLSVLTHAGCDVEIARTGKKAMEKASESKFDVITLDINLPDSSGFDICSELKQRHISYKTPVIFISACKCPEFVAEAKKRGGVDYITKPFDVTDLIYRVIYYTRAQFARESSPASAT